MKAIKIKELDPSWHINKKLNTKYPIGSIVNLAPRELCFFLDGHVLLHEEVENCFKPLNKLGGNK